jgi:hypothetical protein
MGDLKPIGSEKLTGQDKLKRIMEIARFNETIPSNINETAKSEYSIGLADGNRYEIVKERQGYIIKKTISESNTEYLEPMKNRKYYSSYSQAFKRLNLVAGELNRLNENEEGVSFFGEQKKFVLKTPQPKIDSVPSPAPETPITPPAVPSQELPPPPADEVPVEDDEFNIDLDAEEMGPEVDVESPEVDSEGKVTFKTIQKLTGKLTQKIRTLSTQEGMTSEDIKYVINMVLSSFDLNELSEEDREDILSKFEDETEDLGGDDMDGEDLTDDSEVEDIQADMDVEVEEGFMYDDVDEINPDDFGFATHDGSFDDDFGFATHDGSFDGDDSEYDDEYTPKKQFKSKLRKKFGNGAIIDSIFGESSVDKVISKYFEVSKKEILEAKERETKKKLAIVSEVRKQMKSVIKLTETVEQELAAQKFLEENLSAKIIGKTNKKNLVFENKGKEVKISPEGLLV